MPEQQVDFSQILVVPLAQMIQRIGQGVAEAQMALDTSAMEAQNAMQENCPSLAQIGYQVTWYQMPEVAVELKVAVHYESTGDGNKKKSGLFVSPFNAKYKNAFTYSAEGTSTLKLRIVPIPAPISANSR